MWSQISYGSIVFGATLKDRDPSCDGWVLVQPYARVASGRGRFRMQSVYSNDLELLRLFQRGIGAAAAKTAEIGMSAKIIHSEIGDTEYELLPYVVIR